MDPYWLFLVNVVWLIIHELDAIDQQEWRFFFGSFMSDQAAYRLFTALHVPLLVFILANAANREFQIVFNLFLIVHAGLHFALRQHPLILFRSTFSRGWIYGGALLGGLHLALVI